VIVTIGLEELFAKAGLAETSEGSQLTSDQLLRIADEAEIWPTVMTPILCRKVGPAASTPTTYRMDTTLVDQRPTTPNQRPDPAAACPTPRTPAAATATTTRRRMTSTA
jgi:hypothetical protein